MSFWTNNFWTSSFWTADFWASGIVPDHYAAARLVGDFEIVETITGRARILQTVAAEFPIYERVTGRADLT